METNRSMMKRILLTLIAAIGISVAQARTWNCPTVNYNDVNAVINGTGTGPVSIVSAAVPTTNPSSLDGCPILGGNHVCPGVADGDTVILPAGAATWNTAL